MSSICRQSNLESCRHLSEVLSDFCQSSGQLINFHKSSLTFSKNARHMTSKLSLQCLILHTRRAQENILGVQFLKVDQLQQRLATQLVRQLLNCNLGRQNISLKQDAWHSFKQIQNLRRHIRCNVYNFPRLLLVTLIALVGISFGKNLTLITDSK